MATLLTFITLLYFSPISGGVLPRAKRIGRSHIKNMNSSPLKPKTGMQEFSQYVNHARKQNYDTPILRVPADRLSINEIFEENRSSTNEEFNNDKFSFNYNEDKLSPRTLEPSRQPLLAEVQKKPKLFDLSDTAVVLLFKIPNRQAVKDRHRQRNVLTNLPTEGLIENLNNFDEKGRIFLSQPKDVKHRNLNKLLDKVANYTYDKKNLRSRSQSFSKDDLKKLNAILREMKESRKSNNAILEENVPPKSVFDFSELVL